MGDKESKQFLMRSPFEWVEEQKSLEKIGPLWRVHDKLYDLEKFVALHPGGSDWLRASQGLDITELFESAHFLNPSMVDKILAKFFVKMADSRRNSHHTFEPNGFYKTLKKQAAPILKKVGTGPTVRCTLMQDGLAILFIVLFFLGIWKDSVVVQMLAGTILALMSLAAHNFIHLRATWRRFYFDFSLQSSHECLVFHVMSHHMFATTTKDIQVMDIDGLFKHLNLSHIDDKKSSCLLARMERLVVIHGLYAFKNLLELGSRVQRILLDEQELRAENLIVFLQLLTCVVIATTPMAGILAWLTIHVVSSYIFMPLAVAPGHHKSAAANKKNPDDADATTFSTDFGICQLNTISDFSDQHKQSTESSLTLVTFGHHGIHHLFPTVCNSKLHHLGPLCLTVFQEFTGNPGAR